MIAASKETQVNTQAQIGSLSAAEREQTVDQWNKKK